MMLVFFANQYTKRTAKKIIARLIGLKNTQFMASDSQFPTGFGLNEFPKEKRQQHNQCQSDKI
jgi:hypothetical protein